MTYAMLIRVLCSTYAKSLNKKNRAVFEIKLKMHYELHTKYRQKSKYQKIKNFGITRS